MPPTRSPKSVKPFRMPDGVFERDKALGGAFQCDYETLAEVIDLPPVRSVSQGRAMAAIVLDAAVEGQGLDRTISYSRGRDYWSRNRPWHDSVDYSYDHVVPSVDALVEAGLLRDHVKAPSGKPTGWQSSYKAGDALHTLLLPKHRVVQTRELIRIRDRATRHLMPVPDTERVRRQWRWTERFDESLQGITIELDAGTRNGDLISFTRINPDGKEVTHTVHVGQTTYYRSYSGDLDSGGRFYGHWVQGVPSLLREGLILNGDRVAEPDYKTLHFGLLYASAGILLPEGYDPYLAVDWGNGRPHKQRRDLVKRGANTLINAPSFLSARGAIAARIAKADDAFVLGPRGKLQPSRESYAEAEAMITAVKVAHPRVRHLLHRDLGIRFQQIDSEMAREVCDELALKKGIAVVPIHDSFVVPIQSEGICEETMERVREKAFSRVMEKGGRSAAYSQKIQHVLDGALPPPAPASPVPPAVLQSDSSATAVQLDSGSDGSGWLDASPFSDPSYLASVLSDVGSFDPAADHRREPLVALPRSHGRAAPPEAPVAARAVDLVHPPIPAIESVVAPVPVAPSARARRPSFCQPGYDWEAAELAAMAAAPLSGARRWKKTKGRRISP